MDELSELMSGVVGGGWYGALEEDAQLGAWEVELEHEPLDERMDELPDAFPGASHGRLGEQ